MSQFLYSLTLLIAIILSLTNIQKTAAIPPPPYNQNHKTFVKTACSSTTYPENCYKSLSTYSSTIKSDPIKLCTTALNINVKSAKEAVSVVSKLLKKSKKSAAGRKNNMLSQETLILKDCLEEMNDTIVELKQAITEMKILKEDGGDDTVAEHIANVRTWVSAALTDEGTCTDGFEEVKVNKDTKKKVTKVVEELARTTSNTLALLTNLRIN